jgi:hypothetical protein
LNEGVAPFKDRIEWNCYPLKSRTFPYFLSFCNFLGMRKWECKMKKRWSDGENELFKIRYPKYTNKELIDLYYIDMTEKQLWKKANYFGIVKSEETRNRRYRIHSEKYSGINSPLFGIKRSEETKKKLSISHMGVFAGKDNPNWQGGISSLNDYLRVRLSDWKFESLKAYEFKCVITGIHSRELEIHHMYNFSEIVKETLDLLSLPITKVKNYTDDELNEIEKLFNVIHNMHGLGVPLVKELHTLYHKIYGYSENTPDQFEEFKQNYINNRLEVYV